ncbi:MAG TPA: cytochrome P450 [Oscillatoriaceae cyanobacterium]
MAFAEADRAWAVYRYDDVKRVLSDHEAFSSERRFAALGVRQRPNLISLDPPRHRQFRNLVTQAFTPKAVAAMAPRIEAIARSLVDALAPSGHMDLVGDFAYPLPVTVIAEMLGVPPEDRDRYKAWADGLLNRPRPFLINSPERERITAEMDAYFREILAERRARPREDLISALLAATIDGERLEEDDILSFCSLLLLAGHITTVNLIGNTMLCLLEHPEAMAALRANPAAIPGAIEEALRFRSPVQFMTRVAARDVELGGARIEEGQFVLAFLASANRDEAVFDHPDVFDIQRRPNPHLAFGYGIHFCLGAPLARLEGQIALRVLLERLRQLALEPLSDARLSRWAGKPTDPVESPILFGVSHLNLAFQAA